LILNPLRDDKEAEILLKEAMAAFKSNPDRFMAAPKWFQDLYIKAFNFAAKAHKDQKVPGTDLPYIVHLVLVSMEIMAVLAVEDGLDGDLAIQCALLHDVIEDTDTTFEDVLRVFTPDIAYGVLALTKDDEVGSDIEDKHERKKLMVTDSLNRIPVKASKSRIDQSCYRFKKRWPDHFRRRNR